MKTYLQYAKTNIMNKFHSLTMKNFRASRESIIVLVFHNHRLITSVCEQNIYNYRPRCCVNHPISARFHRFYLFFSFSLRRGGHLRHRIFRPPQIFFLATPLSRTTPLCCILQMQTLDQWFPTCGTRTTSGTRRSSRWYASRFCFFFDRRELLVQVGLILSF